MFKNLLECWWLY